MKPSTTTFIKRTLLTGLVALPLMIGSTSALAKSCPNGKCDGPSEAELMVKQIDNESSKIRSAPIASAYESIKQLAETAESKKVDGVRSVKDKLKVLAADLQKRSNAALDQAVSDYFAGYHDKALGEFKTIAELKGLPAAKEASRQIAKEDDRVAWRAARALSDKHIAAADHLDAFQSISEMDRLAKRTDYDAQTKAKFDSYSKQMLTRVAAAEKLITQERFDEAYATLIEISRLSPARKSASEARKMLSKHARLDGMRQARGEYEAERALTTAKTWYDALTNPTVQEKKKFNQQLDQLVARFPGTRAADKAQQMLTGDKQAAR